MNSGTRALGFIERPSMIHALATGRVFVALAEVRPVDLTELKITMPENEKAAADRIAINCSSDWDGYTPVRHGKHRGRRAGAFGGRTRR